jgi:hypothetical protein
MTKKRQILTTGDVVRDMYIYQGDTVFPSQPGKIRPHITDQLGGAKQLHEFISAAVGGSAVFGLEELSEAESQGKPHPAAHVLWMSCPAGLKAENKELPKDKCLKDVWRVAKALGYALPRYPEGEPPLKRSSSAHGRPAVLVIDDAALGFRTVRAHERWPFGVLASGAAKKAASDKTGSDASPPDWIVFKMSSPLAQGDLWRELTGPGPQANLVVVTSADEFRRSGAAISRGFSWERTLSELCSELEHQPAFRPLFDRSRHLIINFGCEGAVWFDNKSCGSSESPVRPEHCVHLIYDPGLTESQWASLLADGSSVYGHMNVFTAAIAVGLFREETADEKAKTDLEPWPRLARAIGRGLTAVRVFRLHGHGESTKKPQLPLDELGLALRDPKGPESTAETVALARSQAKRVAPRGYVWRQIPQELDISRCRDWTLAALEENPADKLDLPLYGLAHRVALYGLGALSGVPHGCFGSLVSVDRNEIETLRGLHQRIDAYKRADLKKPLCLAAFGPPGAGKSFGIKEIAKEILGDKVQILEFNLSQFDSSAMLIGAFHQVRDAVLKGAIPLVFWDEFDSRDYYWLQFLLAPMQDGVFQEDGHTHTVGKCIFVFAGGTSWDFENFGPAPMPKGWLTAHASAEAQSETPTANSIPDAESLAIQGLQKFYQLHSDRIAADQKANEEFRRKKGPDFVSRLDGHINVLGPNRRRLYDWSTRQWAMDDPGDITFPLRRALLLRVFLGAKKGQLEIDRNLLRAFLHVPRYRHGARSLGKIAVPLTESSKPYHRAYLPPPQVLEQHLDSAAAFDAICERYLKFLSPANLRAIAAAVADYYDRTFDGAQLRTMEEALAAFENKTAWEKETNLAAARRLPEVLALAGLEVEEGRAEPGEIKQAADYLSHHLKVLAEEEHRLWMQFHLENGWQKVEPAHKAKFPDAGAWKAEIKRLKHEERRHTMLIPFEELSDIDKTKDYKSILNYPAMANLVGWKIAFTRD